MSEFETKKKYIYPKITCACGSTVNKHTMRLHERSKKHRIFMGEEGVVNLTGKNKKPKELNTNTLSYVLHSKVGDLTEEQIRVRRDYFKVKVRECRANKMKDVEDAMI